MDISKYFKESDFEITRVDCNVKISYCRANRPSAVFFLAVRTDRPEQTQIGYRRTRGSNFFPFRVDTFKKEAKIFLQN